MADSSSLRNFLSFASAVAYSVALAALSFSTCDFVRLNTRNPFICFLFRYLLSVRPNVHGEDAPLGGSVRYCRSFSAAERVPVSLIAQSSTRARLQSPVHHSRGQARWYAPDW